MRTASPRTLVIFVLLLGSFSPITPTAKAATLVHDFYLPMPEGQIQQTFSTIETGVGTTLDSVFSVVITGDGTVIYYDQWEDGYEVDLANPVQSTTQVWGDGNNANGIPPGYVNDPAVLSAGAVLTLRNLVPLPRNPANQLFDARDRMAATKALVVSRAAWATTPGPVLSGAVEVQATIDYGTSYISPVGQDMTNRLFQYVGFVIMAEQNGTAVTIDTDGPGVVAAYTTNLNKGESYLVNGGVKKGGSVNATKAVQVNLVIGRIGGRYATDWFTLYATNQWSDSYYTSVGTANNGSLTYVYLYNPTAATITINYATTVSSGSFTVASNAVFQFQMPKNSGGRFTSSGAQKFFALSTAGASPSSDTSYDWGFTLLPEDGLTTEAVVGWGPGSSDGTVNGSPVWVTPVASTTVYVDYNGDRVGPLTDPRGNKYDTNYTMAALESRKLYDPDKDQTAMRLYTLDGTLITTAWGEDPDVAAPGNPYLDFGTTVLPFPVPVLQKSAIIVTDAPPTGLSLNDVIEYTIQVDNKGLLPLGNVVVVDAPSPSLSYVTNSTRLNGGAIADSPSGTAFPLDAPGYTIPVILRAGTSVFMYRASVVSTGAVTNSATAAGFNLITTNVITAPPGGSATACAMNFTDALGTNVATYSAGGNIYVKVTDADANTSTNSVQTMTAVVSNSTRGDLEVVTLTETGNNTGIFRNAAGLPSSISAGTATQDGTLNVSPGDSLIVSHTDLTYGDVCTAPATVSTPVQTKILYLSGTNSPDQTLDRINPAAAPVDNTTAQTAVLGSSGSVTSAVVGLAAVSTNTGTGAIASLTVSHSPGGGSNRLMLVGISYEDDTPAGMSVSSVTYAGNALTLVTQQVSGEANSQIWRLINPPNVTSNVVVNLTSAAAADAIVVGVATFTNVNQTTPLGTPAAANGSSATATVNVTSATNELVFDTLALDDARTATVGAGQTQRWTGIAGTANTDGIRGAASTEAGTNTVTMSWTVGSDNWAVCAVSIKPVTNAAAGGGTNLVSFIQTTNFCSAFTLASGGTVSITNFITITNGVMPTNPAISAQLRYGTTNIITLTNATYNSAGSNIVWSGVLSSNVTVPSGQAITYVISNSQAGVSYRMDYDSTSKPSRISLPTTNIIDITSLGVYDAPYSGGSLVSTPTAGSILYVRATVNDPFGSYDITSLGLTINGPGSGSDITTTLTNASVVADTGCTKTYEYVWYTTADVGAYDIATTANEGSEGITDTAATSVTLTLLDLGTPGTAEFTSGNNGVSTNAYATNSSVCIRVTDLDQNLTNSVAENLIVTVSSSSGDAETLTLTETATNSGVFTGCLNSTNSGSVTSNGILLAPAGSLLTVSYTDPNDSGDSASANATILTPVGVPSITMNKTLITPADGQAGSGEAVQFNLQIVNSGSTTLTNISVTDTYPATNFVFVSASPAASSNVAGTLTWTNLGSFTPGQVTNITVNFTATNTATLATNTARGASIGGATNTDTATLTITRSALTITKTVLTPTNTVIGLGTNVTFRIITRNSGTTTITNLPLEDGFSAGCFQYVTNTSGPAPNGVGSGSLLWNNLGPLASGASVTNDIVMKAVGGCAPADNTAHADYAVDSFGNPVPSATSTGSTTNIAARITGSVYNDIDRTGTLTTNDVPLDGVTLSLYTDPNADGNPADGALVQLTTTDPTGYYELLNLATGAYVVVETDLPGFASVAPLNNRIALVFSSLTTNAGNNFFDYQPNSTNYAALSGTVWNDTNGNGTNDLGETGLANVNIDLVQDVNTNNAADVGEPVVANALSGTNGAYAFTGVLPGNYVLRETDPFGYYSTGDTQPPNDNQIGISVAAASSLTNRSFFDHFNQAPVANDDTNSTPVNVAVLVSPLGNDSDPDGNTLSIISVSPTNGTISSQTSSNFVFTPNLNFIGTATIGYTISDGYGGTASALITITVTARADVSITKTANGSVTAGQNLTYTLTVTNAGPSTATNVIASDTLPAGVAVFNLGGGVSNNGVVTWPAIPTLASGGASNYTLIITAPANGILTNFANVTNSTPDPTLTNNTTPPVITTVGASADVSIMKSATNSVTAGANLSYTITVTNAGPSTATNVVVTDPLPSGAVFVSATGAGTTNGSGVVTWPTNASLASGGSVSYTLVVAAPADGILSLTNVASVTTPTPDPTPTNNVTPPVLTTVTPSADVRVGKSGPAAVMNRTNFNYTISVTNFGPSTATSLSVTDSLPAGLVFVSAVPAAVTNGSEVVWTNLGSLTLGATTNLTLTVISTGTGSVTNFATGGSPVADPNPTNNTGGPVVTAITNVPPVAVNDTATTPEDTAVTVNVLTNDFDLNGDLLTLTNVLGVTNGTVNIVGTNVVYTPATNFFGTNVFSYVITDGSLFATGTVTVVVTPVNDAPVAVDDAKTTLEDVPVTISVLTNDFDVDGDTLTITNVTSTNGTVSIVGTNVLYTPSTNFNGTNVFSYIITDGNGGSATGLVTVVVTPVNDAPVAVNDAFTTPEDVPATISVLTNDFDVDGDTLTITNAVTTNGTVSIVGTNLLYTPATNFHGTNVMTYIITDGNGGSATGLVTVVVTPVNDVPVVVNDSYSVFKNLVLTVPATGILTNDSDVDGDTLTVLLVATTTNGVLTLNSNGGFVYTPVSNYFGPDTFTYQATDGSATSAVATVSINVLATNSAPATMGESYTTLEDTALNIAAAAGVLTNDTDVDGDALTAVLVATTTNGVLTLSTNGSFTYAPNTNFFGADAFTYRANDGTTNSAVTLVTITVTPVNDAPSFNLPAGTTNAVGATWTPRDSNRLWNSIASSADGSKLVAVVNGGQIYTSTDSGATWTPRDSDRDWQAIASSADGSKLAAGENVGPIYTSTNSGVTWTAQASGNRFWSSIASSADGSKLAATALNEQIYTSTDSGVTWTAQATNRFWRSIASSSDGGKLAAVEQGGQIYTSVDSGVTWTARESNRNWYSIASSADGSKLAAVEAGGQIYTSTDSGVTWTAQASGSRSWRSIASSADGSKLAAVAFFDQIYTSTDSGVTWIARDSNRSWYAVASSADGSQLAAVDSGGQIYTSVGTASPYTISVAANSGLYSAANFATNILAGPANEFTQAVTFIVTNDNAAVFTVAPAIATNGTLTFTPSTVLGTASVTVIAHDNGGTANGGVDTSTAQTFTIIVTNTPPVATNDSYSMVKNQTLTVPTISGVLANDTDANGDALTAILVGTTTNGSLTLSNNGSFVYTPVSNYTGLDTFTYQASDGPATSGVATVTITILATNSAPVAVNDAYTTAEDTALTVPALSGVLTNDVDVDGNVLTSLLVSNVTHGTLALSTNGGFLYTPNTNYNGPDTFTYRAFDGVLTGNVATVTITVTPVNDAPVAVNDTKTTQEDVPVTISVLTNDFDVDGDSLTITDATTTNGTVSIVGTNLLYMPATNFNGTNVMTYVITDGNGGSATGQVTVVVTPVNDPPVAVADSAAAFEDTAVTISVLTNDFDIDGDTLTITNATTTNGTVSVVGTNLLFRGATNFAGTVIFPYIITDGHGGSATGLVTVVITRLADVRALKSGPASVISTNNFTYTVTITNLGPSTASNVVASDTLPAGFTLVSALPNTATLSGNVLSWPAFTLAEARGSNFTVTVSSTNGGTYTNIASSTSTTPDPSTNNNDGSLTNSRTVTVVTPVADVSVRKLGITNVLAGSNFVYTIIVSNAGPAIAPNIVVTDALPAGITFVSATGGGVFTNSSVLWQLSSLARGTSSNLTLTVMATTVGSKTNIVRAGFPGIDPVTNNNNGSLTNSRVVTTVTVAADVAIFLSGPTNATKGVAYTNILTVTNMGPLSATNVIVRDLLPTNLTFVSATGGGVFSNNIVTWPTIPIMTNGRTATFSIIVLPNTVGSVTNVVTAASVTPDPNLANNNGTLPASQSAVQVDPSFVGIALDGVITFNPQTGLYEQRVTVTNVGNVTFAALRLYSTVISNTTPPIILQNAIGTNGGKPYVQYNAPLDPSNYVTFVLEFYNPLRVNFSTLLEAEASLPPPLTASTNGAVFISRIFQDQQPGHNGRIVIEWVSIPGKVYTVIYSNDTGTNWLTATPSVTAIANSTQWYDDGPPKTISTPASVPGRIYRVIQSP